MPVIKISSKKKLEQLQARLTLCLGNRPTQQEVVDLFVQLASEKFEDLVSMIDDLPVLTPEKVEKILKRRDNRLNIPYELNEEYLSDDDRDIYS